MECDRNEEEDSGPSRDMTPQAFIRQEGMPIVIEEDRHEELSTDSRKWQGAFASVSGGSWDDAQILGFIPKGVAEDQARRAISEDDAFAYEAASRMISHGGGCNCDGGENSRMDLRAMYMQVRRRNNPALSRLLSDSLGTRVEWDSPVAASIRKWAVTPRWTIIAALVSDITINRNAVLSVDPRSRLLLAHDIWIHRQGTLKTTGSYLRIWANSLNQFSIRINQKIVEELKEMRIPWRHDL